VPLIIIEKKRLIDNTEEQKLFTILIVPLFPFDSIPELAVIKEHILDVRTRVQKMKPSMDCVINNCGVEESVQVWPLE